MKTRPVGQTGMALVAKITPQTILTLGITLLLLMVARPAVAQTFSLLHTFSGTAGADGANPYAGLIVDSSGNFYGTTQYGGIFGFGTVYELPAAGGENVLYNFTGGIDGASPTGGLILDSAGNLYGTTIFGGNLNDCDTGCGVVFKLDPQGTETILYTFTGQADGGVPLGGLIRDSAGNFYGTTSQGGRNGRSCGLGCGIVFKLDPAGQETVLHNFTGAPEGAIPMASLVEDAAGNLYGTTEIGGTGCINSSGCGTVFKVDRHGNETILYSFTGGPDGQSPQSALVLDSGGNLYGTTTNGGANRTCALGNTFGCGVVFKVDPTGKETVLFTFRGGTSGAFPFAGVVRDAKGNLYGTAGAGGNVAYCRGSGCGIVFKLSPRGNETILHTFQSTDGNLPLGNLLLYKGHVYGATAGGGSNGNLSFGVAFRVLP